MQVIQTEKPPEPWVWVDWYESEFASTKVTSVSETSKVAAGSGAPWTLDSWLTSGSHVALVFVYWSDTKDHRGYASGKVNSDLWFDEDVACVARAFDCYRVDAKKADKEALAFYKVKQVPCVLILDQDRNRVASIDKFGNARSLVSFLQDTLKGKFPDRWSQFQDGLKEIAKSFGEGKAAVQRQDFDSARDRLSFVVGHEFRTEDYPRAKELLAKSEKKLKK